MLEAIKPYAAYNQCRVRSDQYRSSPYQHRIYHLDDLFSENSKGQD